MKRLLLALPLLAAAAGCATTQPYAPVRDVAYQAIGAQPLWTLAIGDNSIVLRTQAGERRWPRVLPRIADDETIWQAGDGPDQVTITTRRTGCRAGPRFYNDSVTVETGAGRLTGCGGLLVPQDRR